jgi:hypothetical protein
MHAMKTKHINEKGFQATISAPGCVVKYSTQVYRIVGKSFLKFLKTFCFHFQIELWRQYIQPRDRSYLATEHGIKTQKTRVFTTLKNFTLHTVAIYLIAGNFYFTEIKSPSPLTVTNLIHFHFHNHFIVS